MVLIAAPFIIIVIGVLCVVKMDMDADFNPSRDKLERYNARHR